MAGQTSSTKFKPGESGNPNGRPPKEWTMAGLIKEALEERDEFGVPKKVYIAKRLIELADRGEITALKEINNRIDGLPTESIKHSGQIEYKPILGGLTDVHSNNRHKETSEPNQED